MIPRGSWRFRSRHRACYRNGRRSSCLPATSSRSSQQPSSPSQAAPRADEWDSDEWGDVRPAGGYDVSVDLNVQGAVAFESFHGALQPYGDWVAVGSYGRVWRPRVAAGLAPLLLRALGVDERGLALGVGRALGLGRVPLRPLGLRPVLRMAVGARLRVGARVGLVAHLRRRDRLGAARARVLGLRLVVPVHRLLVDLRPERPVRVGAGPHRRVRSDATRAAGSTRPRPRPRGRPRGGGFAPAPGRRPRGAAPRRGSSSSGSAGP